jgi:hypothetical protein
MKQAIILFSALFVLPTVCPAGGLTLEAEGGLLWQPRNDFRIPNTPGATEVDLSSLAGTGPYGAARLFVNWDVASTHRIQFTLAPLQISETVELPDETSFAGTVFEPGEADAVYRFNSWRAGYSHLFHQGDHWSWRVGFTAKIRDAKISLSQDGLYAEKTDLGFVPLLYFRGEYSPCPRTRAALDFNGLAGGPGRAFDVSLKLIRDMTDRVSISAGYRTIEGGADVESVYSFAWLNYVVLGMEIRL